MTAVELCYARLNGPEEGRRAFAYNDATGKRVTCQPGGNLSIAVGVNLEVGLDDEEIDWLSKHRVQKIAEHLQQFSWYAPLDPVRQSVLVDIAFNNGVNGLLHFPHLLAAVSRQDWASASTECRVADPRLADRYQKLAQLLLIGGVS